MTARNDEFLARLRATFNIEAQEHLQALSTGLLELEKAADPDTRAEIIETVFREAHSLKGAARAVNAKGIEAVSQSLEGVLDALKRNAVGPTPELFDGLSQTVDHLGRLLSSPEAARPVSEETGVSRLVSRLENGARGTRDRDPGPGGKRSEAATPSPPPISAPAPPAPVMGDTVRVTTAKLDAILLQAGELQAAKLAAAQRLAELREIRTALEAWKRRWAKAAPDLRRLDEDSQRTGNKNGDSRRTARVAQLLEVADWNQSCLRSLDRKLTALERTAGHDERSLAGMVSNLLDDMKQALMFPFASLLGIFPRLVRDLARDKGKQVEFVAHGSEIEIDKRILEEIKDPLIHLVRNCIDHGIERPVEREQKGKLPLGTVIIAIAQKDGANVEIVVSDDGAGIDVAKVRAAAVRRGLASQTQADSLGEQEACGLIFQSGFSTSPMITDISGRGLGLAIVREKVRRLNGALSLETRPDAGTTFRLVLPLTLATYRGVIVRVVEHLFVLPTANLQRVARVKKDQIRTVENRETIRSNGQTVSLVRLNEVLELAPASAASESQASLPVVILAADGKHIAFQVDEVGTEQEVLVKTLGRQLARVRNIAGATVLGTGQVVPILNVADLMKSALHRGAAGARRPPGVLDSDGGPKRKSVLVAEDSITARTLLKNILEAAGYSVTTAVDGVDALTQLRGGGIDLLVSDVEMPRMNGFGLTAKIRDDKTLAELPVVLVTSRTSREDREQGLEVGANAYIVKSDFDQTNLLQIIESLT